MHVFRPAAARRPQKSVCDEKFRMTHTRRHARRFQKANVLKETNLVPKLCLLNVKTRELSKR